MSKSLRSMSELERKEAIARRLASNTKGLGYWAAVDAQTHILVKRITVLQQKLATPENKVKAKENNYGQ